MYQGRHRPHRPLGFTGILRQREFGMLWLADAQSWLGDQLARVALAVLVFHRTGSGFATAAVYALTFLPDLVGGVLLGPIADRLPPRTLLIGGDLARAVLIAAMAVPGMPLAAVAALLVVAVLIGTPWNSAERSLTVALLSEQDYPTGTGLRTATQQASQLVGFAVGGVAVASTGPNVALLIDAATFVASAILIRIGVHRRASPQTTRASGWSRDWFGGGRALFGDPRLRPLLGLTWIFGVTIIPEGLAAPYAAELGGGSETTGLLLAANPAGIMVGSLIFSRLLQRDVQRRSVGPLAVATGLPLVACALHPGTVVTMALWGVTGLCSAYQIQVFVEVVRLIPSQVRASAIGMAAGGLLASQGLGVLAGGALLFVLPPSTTVATAGLVTSLSCMKFAEARRRSQTGVNPTPATTH